MEQTISYKPKSPFMDKFWGIIFPVLMVVVPIVYPFNVGTSSFTIIPYPWTIPVFSVLGVIMFLSYLRKIKKESALKKVDCNIYVKDGVVTYNDYIKGKIERCSFNVADVTKVEEDNSELIVTTKDSKKYEFPTEYFEGNNESAFRKILEQGN